MFSSTLNFSCYYSIINFLDKRDKTRSSLLITEARFQIRMLNDNSTKTSEQDK